MARKKQTLITHLRPWFDSYHLIYEAHWSSQVILHPLFLKTVRSAFIWENTNWWLRYLMKLQPKAVAIPNSWRSNSDHTQCTLRVGSLPFHSLEICKLDRWEKLMNTKEWVSDDKIQITILKLRQGPCLTQRTLGVLSEHTRYTLKRLMH